MFSYLFPDQVDAIESLTPDDIIKILQKDRSSFIKRMVKDHGDEGWLDLCAHYFSLPISSFQIPEKLFFYLSKHKAMIDQFNHLREKSRFKDMHALVNCALENKRYNLAICFSLAMAIDYKTAGHIICVHTYQERLLSTKPNKRSFYAYQAALHIYLAMLLYEDTKPLLQELGDELSWDETIKLAYGSIDGFVKMGCHFLGKYLDPELLERAEDEAITIYNEELAASFSSLT